MTTMNFDSCLQKFKETVGAVVALEITGPDEDGKYSIRADSDTAILFDDGSYECESKTLTTSLEKHFGKFHAWYMANMTGPSDQPKGEGVEEEEVEIVNGPPFQGKAHAMAIVEAKKKVRKVRSFDVRAMQIDNLTIEDVMADFQTDPPLTRQEAKKFVLMCAAKGLNPYLGEVYVVKYASKSGGESKASIIVGKDAFMRKADEHPNFSGMKAGVVVIKPGVEEPIERVGTLVLPNETLFGGWAEIHRTDRVEPIKSVVSLSEYACDNKMWREKKATMIRKVAIVAGLREAFAGDFGGMYDSAEMDREFDPRKEVRALV